MALCYLGVLANSTVLHGPRPSLYLYPYLYLAVLKIIFTPYPYSITIKEHAWEQRELFSCAVRKNNDKGIRIRN
jgi:hypothetical protein